MEPARRNILVVGATGKQGSATVHHLLSRDSPADFHVWALTRNKTSPTARKLVEDAEKAEAAGRLHLIEGNLEDADGIRKVFETIAADGGLWGVFVAIAFPGLGAKDDREKDQGILLADLALEFSVEAFVYSSTLQPAPPDGYTPEYSRLSKRAIEDYCKQLSEKGLKWIIMQPGFFMENFEGVMGSIAISTFREGLKEDTTLALIAAEDIGRVAAGVFADHQQYIHKVLGLASETLTPREVMAAYQRGASKSMPAIPAFLARMLLRWNSGVQGILADLEKHQEARRDGSFESFEEEVRLGNSVCKLQSFEEWARKKSGTTDAGISAGWNRLSIANLLTGRA